MLSVLADAMDRALGLGVPATDLRFTHMATRSTVVFCFALLIVRLADRRFLGRNAGFDWMLGVVLGSVLSRGINGQAAFFPTLGASALLVLFHHVLSAVAFRFHGFSRLVKGQPRVLVRDGKIDESELSRSNITRDDLDENLRLNGNENGTDDIAEARLERNGSISVVKAKSKP
jgi:uncharacterized membrane protein YcaP (DUF421 family)